MPKIKTHRAAAKRFRKTASGKFKAGHANRSHILTKKATKRKRGLRATNIVRAEDREGRKNHGTGSLLQKGSGQYGSELVKKDEYGEAEGVSMFRRAVSMKIAIKD